MAVYKQTRQALTVYVVGKGTGRGGGKKTAAESETSQDKGEVKKKKDARVRNMLVKQVGNFALRTAPNFIIGNIGSFTGDSNYQAEVQRQMEVISDVGMTGLSSALAFAVNPALGALSLGFSAISMATKYEQRNINKDVQTFKQTQSVNYAKARSGIDLTDGRTRLR